MFRGFCCCLLVAIRSELWSLLLIDSDVRSDTSFRIQILIWNSDQFHVHPFSLQVVLLIVYIFVNHGKQLISIESSFFRTEKETEAATVLRLQNTVRQTLISTNWLVFSLCSNDNNRIKHV